MNNQPVPLPDCPSECRVHDHVPMAHVADVDRSIRFYALLGYSCDSRLDDGEGKAYYAAMSSGQAELMLVLANGPVNASQQAVLFYMYSQDVHALKVHLQNKGVPAAGRAPGLRKAGDSDVPIPPGPCVFDPTYPVYMNEGEVRVHDSDDYVILIGQCDFRKQSQPGIRRATVGCIGQIAITVRDVEVATRYYCDVIGLKLLLRAGANLAFLSDGALRIMLSTPQGAGKIGTNSILYFTVGDIEATYTSIVERGSDTERPPQLAAKMPDHELWIGFLRDPDGNLVGLMEEKRVDR